MKNYVKSLLKNIPRNLKNLKKNMTFSRSRASLLTQKKIAYECSLNTEKNNKSSKRKVTLE